MNKVRKIKQRTDLLSFARATYLRKMDALGNALYKSMRDHSSGPGIMRKHFIHTDKGCPDGRVPFSAHAVPSSMLGKDTIPSTASEMSIREKVVNHNLCMQMDRIINKKDPS